MLLKKLEKDFLMLLPPESVLGVADFEAFQMQLAKQALVAIAVRLAEDRFGPVSLVTTSLDQAVPAKQGEPAAETDAFSRRAANPVALCPSPKSKSISFRQRTGSAAGVL